MSGLGGLNKSPNGVVVGLVQLQLPVVETPAQLAAQTQRICEMVGKARRNLGTMDLVVFPEYALHGLSMSMAPELMVTLDGPEVAAFKAACVQHRIWGCFSIMEANPHGNPYNSGLIVNDQGEIKLYYRKLHPWIPVEPWEPGNLGVCAAEGGARVGPARGRRQGAARSPGWTPGPAAQRRMRPLAGPTRRAAAIHGAGRRCALVVWARHTPRARLARRRDSPRRGPRPLPRRLLSVPVCDGPKGSKLALIVCHDGMFPEMAREAAYKGAEIVLRTAGYTAPIRHAWKITNQANAFQNLAITASVCLCGSDGSFDSMGEAMFCNFDGTLIAEGGGRVDEIVSAELRPDLVREARAGWGVENNTYQIYHRGYVAVQGGAQDCPYTYMQDMVAGRYRLPWNDSIQVTDGTPCGFAPPTRPYIGAETNPVVPEPTASPPPALKKVA